MFELHPHPLHVCSVRSESWNVISKYPPGRTSSSAFKPFPLGSDPNQFIIRFGFVQASHIFSIELLKTFSINIEVSSVAMLDLFACCGYNSFDIGKQVETMAAFVSGLS